MTRNSIKVNAGWLDERAWARIQIKEGTNTRAWTPEDTNWFAKGCEQAREGQITYKTKGWLNMDEKTKNKLMLTEFIITYIIMFIPAYLYFLIKGLVWTKET